MKKLNMETKFNVVKEMANELGIKYVGVKKEVIIENINNKIDEIEASKSQESQETPKETKKAGKWYEQEGAFPYTEGTLMIITNHPNKAIVGRMVEVSGPSTKRNAVKCFLISGKNGQKQKTHLSLDFDMVTEHTPQYPALIPSIITA